MLRVYTRTLFAAGLHKSRRCHVHAETKKLQQQPTSGLWVQSKQCVAGLWFYLVSHHWPIFVPFAAVVLLNKKKAQNLFLNKRIK